MFLVRAEVEKLQYNYKYLKYALIYNKIYNSSTNIGDILEGRMLGNVPEEERDYS